MAEEIRKICMLGDFGVGKTSLVDRFVNGAFSGKYLSTVGVKIDTKPVQFGSRRIKLVLWDLAGCNPLDGLAKRHLMGAHGLVVVADGTRPDTLAAAQHIHQQTGLLIGTKPTALLINKADLQAQWRFTDADMQATEQWATHCWVTSALTGNHVEEAFMAIAQAA